MTDLPDDPHSERIGRYSQILKDGKMLLDTLEEQQHYTNAMTVIEALTHDQLAHLALTVAAGAVLTRAEGGNDGDIWINWWRGVDGGGPDAMDTSPGVMARILRPDS